MKKLLSLALVCTLSFGFGGFNAVASSSVDDRDNIAMTNEEQESNQVLNDKRALMHVVQITKEIERGHGSLDNFEKVGGLYFDSNGILHLKYKASTAKGSTNAIAVQSITNIVSEENIVTDLVEYSTLDLEEIKEKILVDIQDAYSEDEYNKLAFVAVASFANQKVILEHNALSETLINQIKANYGDVFEEKKTDSVPKVAKVREADWNQLGAGLGIKNKNGGGCSTAGMASKSGNYFILTAAHCFVGETSSTGGDLIRQWDTNVGRQHAIGSGAGLDVGLVRVTGTYLTGGRYATNKIKRWSSTDVFDGSFSNWTTMYDGVNICKTGKTTNTTCGLVTNANTTVKYEGYPTFKVAEISGTNYIKKGDSGGAAFYQSGSTLYLAGIASGFNTVNGTIVSGYVTQYRDVQAHYGITFYTSDTNYKIVN
ncbi:S1 family peptidase [Sporosarcina soli]|uniref:S1 family peptidase n=1 Tax=Sporosarcina soli TaxID=334736 RepID=A0ABW0TT97_9BACL